MPKANRIPNPVTAEQRVSHPTTMFAQKDKIHPQQHVRERDFHPRADKAGRSKQQG